VAASHRVPRKSTVLLHLSSQHAWHARRALRRHTYLPSPDGLNEGNFRISSDQLHPLGDKLVAADYSVFAEGGRRKRATPMLGLGSCALEACLPTI
jgi:hypothetical protein